MNRSKVRLGAAAAVGALLIGSAGYVLHSRSGPPQPTAPFHGIYQFTGTPLPDNPSVAGTVLLYSWSQLEPQEGFYNWSLIDADMAPWVAQHKKVAIRVQTVLPTKGAPVATPPWVFAQGVRSINDSRTMVPVYWDWHYSDDLQTFIRAFAQQWDGNPNVSWFQGGIGSFGETSVDYNASMAPTWRAIGYTDQLWYDTFHRIVDMYKAAFVSTPVAISLNSITFFDGTPGYDENSTLDWLRTRGIWPQYDGIQETTGFSDSNWTNGPVLMEQRNATTTSGDTLAGDLAAMIRLHATYALVYGSDLADPANASILATYAGMATPTPTLAPTVTATSTGKPTPTATTVVTPRPTATATPTASPTATPMIQPPVPVTGGA